MFISSNLFIANTRLFDIKAKTVFMDTISHTRLTKKGEMVWPKRNKLILGGHYVSFKAGSEIEIRKL